jgi:predicted acetyltransferase
VHLHDAWLAAHEEWGPGEHEDGFGLDAHTEVITAEGFAEWVEAMHAEEDSSIWAGPTVRGCFYRWIMDGDEVVGGIAARVSESEFVRRNGHVGYGIRPSARRRGIATWALGQVARQLFDIHGLTRLCVVCEADNGASVATIERNGGRLDTETSTAHVNRYWIEK